MMSPEQPDSSTPPPGDRRVIKRYSNRKLYDTRDSRYVTLLQIAEMVRSGEDVQILDNATKADKTDVTLALIISEELKARPRGIPLVTLKALIRHRGEKLLSQLREGPIGRFIPPQHGAETVPDSEPEPLHAHPEEDEPASEEGDVTTKESPQKGLRATLEQWQHAVDERIRAALPNFSTFSDLQAQLARVSERLDALEKRLDALDRNRRG